MPSPKTLISALRKCEQNIAIGCELYGFCDSEIVNIELCKMKRLADKIEKRLLFMLGIIVIKHSDTIANAKFDVIHLPLMDFTKEQKK